LDTRRREFEAEAVNWIVCSRQGVDPGSYRYLEAYLDRTGSVPDISLNHLLVAANHIEMLGTKRFRAKKVEGRSQSGDQICGLLSVNTGKPVSEEAINLAERIIAKLAAEQAIREGPVAS
jgi:hypothetical protein